MRQMQQALLIKLLKRLLKSDTYVFKDQKNISKLLNHAPTLILHTLVNGIVLKWKSVNEVS